MSALSELLDFHREKNVMKVSSEGWKHERAQRLPDMKERSVSQNAACVSSIDTTSQEGDSSVFEERDPSVRPRFRNLERGGRKPVASSTTYGPPSRNKGQMRSATAPLQTTTLGRTVHVSPRLPQPPKGSSAAWQPFAGRPRRWWQRCWFSQLCVRPVSW